MLLDTKILLSCLLISIFCGSNFGSAFQLDEKPIIIDMWPSNGGVKNFIYNNKVEMPAHNSMRVLIKGFLKDNILNSSYAVLQIHCFHYNLSVSFENDDKRFSKITSNIGFMIQPDYAEKVFLLENNNHNEIHFLITVYRYSRFEPIPGGCFAESNISESTINLVKTFEIEEKENFLTLKVPPAKEPLKSCEDSDLIYETYYTYIDALDFTVDAYFKGVEQMLYSGMLSSYKVKKVPKHNIHLFETIAGRGLIINTVVKRKNGESAFYISHSSFSCPPNTWLYHCSDTSLLKRAISVVLVFHSVVMMLNLMLPDFIESLLSGMLIGGISTVVFIKSYEIELQSFDHFIIIMIGSFLMCAIFGTISLYISMGRYLTKLLLGNLIAVFIMEFFMDDITSINLQVLIAFTLSIFFAWTSVTFSVLLGGLNLILNVSYLIKIGNLHRIVINNFLAFSTVPSYADDESVLDNVRVYYINYTINFNHVDYMLIVLYIVISIFLTIRKERYFFDHPYVLNSEHLFSDSNSINMYNCDIARKRRENGIIGIKRMDTNRNFRITSRCRRQYHNRSNVINERSPLISHWLTTDDAIAEDDGDESIFQLPPPTSRFVQRLNNTQNSDQNDDIIDFISI